MQNSLANNRTIKLNIPQTRLELGHVFENAYLTKRETEVLRYVILGYTAKRVAIILNISYRTVETYIENIKFKLRCNSKGEIIEKAIKTGLLNLLDI